MYFHHVFVALKSLHTFVHFFKNDVSIHTKLIMDFIWIRYLEWALNSIKAVLVLYQWKFLLCYRSLTTTTCIRSKRGITFYELALLHIVSSCLAIQHTFCVLHLGWTEYFIVKINEGQSRRVRCMAPKCNAICDEAVIRKLVIARRPDLAERFERFLLESYIEDNDTVKWCPSIPHCGNAIRVKGDIYCEVECTCGCQFCFNCSLQAHSPCSCMMWELWIKKCRDESETVNWITVNTKPCPKCHKPVEKNGGCNLVACICGQAFWWDSLLFFSIASSNSQLLDLVRVDESILCNEVVHLIVVLAI